MQLHLAEIADDDDGVEPSSEVQWNANKTTEDSSEVQISKGEWAERYSYGGNNSLAQISSSDEINSSVHYLNQHIQFFSSAAIADFSRICIVIF